MTKSVDPSHWSMQVDQVGAQAVQHVAGHRADGAQGDRILTQAGQDAFDVVHEHRAGADDEDAAALEAPPVGVEKVRRPVQGHDGLAGAGAAGDDRDAGVVGADRLVLLGLDGGDDVLHAGAARPRQRRHERALADDGQVVDVGFGVQQVVLDADDLVE